MSPPWPAQAHIHYLHADSFGSRDKPEVRDIQYTSDEYGVTATFTIHNKPVNAFWALFQVGCSLAVVGGVGWLEVLLLVPLTLRMRCIANWVLLLTRPPPPPPSARGPGHHARLPALHLPC